MQRTTVMLPESLKTRLKKEAAREKISFGEIVRRALDKYILAKRGNALQDSFLSSRTILHDEGPTDVAERHDDYLSKKEPY